MKHYLDQQTNQIYAFELDGSQDHLIKPNWEIIDLARVNEFSLEKRGGLDIVSRSKRNSLLGELDLILANPLRWTSLSDEKKLEFEVYRQALLDVPDQPGFPSDISWPTLPSFDQKEI